MLFWVSEKEIEDLSTHLHSELSTRGWRMNQWKPQVNSAALTAAQHLAGS